MARRRHPFLFRPLFGLLLVSVVMAATPAAADHVDNQAGAKELHSGCQEELQKYCPGNTLTVQPQVSCLHEYYTNLSISCRIALKHRAAMTPRPS